MTVTSVETDTDDLSLTLVAEFAAPIERVWELWSDARQLEQWWGPPTWPATVEQHDLTPGGDVAYLMTGPDGETSRGRWRVTAVERPTSLEFVDVFANDDGSPNLDMPSSTTHVQLSEHDGGTRMVVRTVFDSREQMDQLVEMGMVEGIRESAGQIDAVLAG